jgi:hypothetical protein
MFKLRRYPHVSSGVIWHEQTPPALLAEADFAAVGVVNAGPFFRKIIEAKGPAQNKCSKSGVPDPRL